MILLASFFISVAMALVVSMSFHFHLLWQRGLLGFAWRTDRFKGEAGFLFLALASTGAALVCLSWS